MPRKNLLRVRNLPYHVTTRTLKQEFFKLELKEVWEILLESLKEANTLYPIQLVSLVLMNNHYHMLLFTPDYNLDKFMYEFNRRMAIKIIAKTNQSHSVFGNRYKWSVIRSKSYLFNCYRYIYQNPIRAGLCWRVEEYPFSTIYYIHHGIHFIIPLFDQFGFKDKFMLDWLNIPMEEDEKAKVKKGLRRFVEPKKVKT